jgi:hypothetical protein
MSCTATAQQMIQKMFYSQYIDNPNKIIELSNGGFLFSHGYSSSSMSFSYSFTRLDTSLNILWTKEYVLPSYKTYLWYHKEILPDTFVVWGKIADSSNVLVNSFLLKIDGNGQVISSKMLFGLNNFYVKDIVWSHEQQRLVLYGKKEVTAFYDERMQVLAYDKDLNYVWGKEYVYGFQDDLTDAQFFGTNGMILSANISHDIDSSSTEPCCVPMLIRIDTMGNVMWIKRVGNIPNLYQGNGYSYTGGLLVLDTKELINVFQSAYFNNSPVVDIIVQKTDSMGNEVKTLRVSNPTSPIRWFHQIIKNQHLILRLNSFTNFMIDENLNYIDFKRIVASNMQTSVMDQKACANGQTVILGQYMPSKKISIVKTDSMSNIGCNQYPFVACPYQFVSFPNTDAYYQIRDSSIVVADSTIAITASGNMVLQDSVLCNTASSIQEVKRTSIKVYPAITQDKVIVASGNEEVESVEVYSLSGEKLKQYHFNPEEIDLRWYSKGMYVIRISSQSEVYMFKILLQ